MPTSEHGIERLVQSDKFILDRLRLGDSNTPLDDNRFHILAVVEGAVSISTKNGNCNLQRGGTALVPATTREVKIAPQDQAVLLDMYLP